MLSARSLADATDLASISATCKSTLPDETRAESARVRRRADTVPSHLPGATVAITTPGPLSPAPVVPMAGPSAWVRARRADTCSLLEHERDQQIHHDDGVADVVAVHVDGAAYNVGDTIIVMNLLIALVFEE